MNICQIHLSYHLHIRLHTFFHLAIQIYLSHAYYCCSILQYRLCCLAMNKYLYPKSNFNSIPHRIHCYLHINTYLFPLWSRLSNFLRNMIHQSKFLFQSHVIHHYANHQDNYFHLMLDKNHILKPYH